MPLMRQTPSLRRARTFPPSGPPAGRIKSRLTVGAADGDQALVVALRPAGRVGVGEQGDGWLLASQGEDGVADPFHTGIGHGPADPPRKPIGHHALVGGGTVNRQQFPEKVERIVRVGQSEAIVSETGGGLSNDAAGRLDKPAPCGHSNSMFRRLLLPLALLLAFATAATAASPRRIVSLSPGTTEMLFALGLGPVRGRRHGLLHLPARR